MKQLYKFKKNDIEPRFAFVKDNIIQNNIDWNQWQRVSSKDVLLKIGSLAFSKKTAAVMPAVEAATLMGAATAMAMAAGRWKDDQKECHKLWNKNQSIPGNVFLHPNGKLIWISDIDLKYFEKVKDKSGLEEGRKKSTTMKLTEKQLRKMVKEAVEKNLQEDYNDENTYSGLDEIHKKYLMKIINVLAPHNKTLPKGTIRKVVDIAKEGMEDAFKEGNESGWDQGVADEFTGANRP